MRIHVSSAKIRRRREGVATIVILILITMVLGFIIANIAVLSALHKDVKLIEQRQIRRIHSTSAHASTNSPTAPPTK